VEGRFLFSFLQISRCFFVRRTHDSPPFRSFFCAATTLILFLHFCPPMRRPFTSDAERKTYITGKDEAEAGGRTTRDSNQTPSFELRDLNLSLTIFQPIPRLPLNHHTTPSNPPIHSSSTHPSSQTCPPLRPSTSSLPPSRERSSTSRTSRER